MQDRYEIRPLAAGTFGVWDAQWGSLCSLGDSSKPLVWADRHQAADWLTACYLTWGMSPAVGQEPPPSGAWPMKRRFYETATRSPWETWQTPPADSRFGI